MRLSRAELLGRLDMLDASIMGLQAVYQHDFIEAFASAAEGIGAMGSSEDRVWVEDQALEILGRHGIVLPVPGDG